MASTTLAYVHPISGLLVTGIAVYVGSLGLQSRRGTRRAVQLRARHRAVTPWLYGALVVSYCAGVASTVWLRDDLDEAASGHFAVGSLSLLLFSLAALLSRAMDRLPWARSVHPWLGAAGVLLAGVQVFLGLQIMPH
jgi:hypothetical protein